MQLAEMDSDFHICVYISIIRRICEVAHRSKEMLSKDTRPTSQTTQGTLLSSGHITTSVSSNLCLSRGSQSQDREHGFTCPLLGQRKAGPPDQQPLPSSLPYHLRGQVALWQKRTGRRKKGVYHVPQVCISAGKAKTNMNMDIRRESNHHPKTGVLSHAHPLSILRNQEFAAGYYQLRRDPHRIRRIFFFINKNVTGPYYLIPTFHKKAGAPGWLHP